MPLSAANLAAVGTQILPRFPFLLPRPFPSTHVQSCQPAADLRHDDIKEEVGNWCSMQIQRPAR